MKPIMFAITLFMTFNCTAEKLDKVIRVMELSGLYEMIEQQIESMPQMYVETSKQIVAEIDDTHDLTKEIRKGLLQATEEYMADNSTIRAEMEHVVALWANHYGKYHSEEDLDRLIAFYESDLGRREIEATQKAMVDFTKDLSNLLPAEDEFDASLAEYTKKITQILKECDCENPS